MSEEFNCNIFDLHVASVAMTAPIYFIIIIIGGIFRHQVQNMGVKVKNIYSQSAHRLNRDNHQEKRL